VSWIPLSLLVVSSPFSTIFLIGCYLEGPFHALLASGAYEGCTGSLFMNILFVQDSPNHKAISLYLMLNDERFPNSLLSVGLLPSTSNHILWK
jgi:hypothetical protein